MPKVNTCYRAFLNVTVAGVPIGVKQLVRGLIETNLMIAFGINVDVRHSAPPNALSGLARNQGSLLENLMLPCGMSSQNGYSIPILWQRQLRSDTAVRMYRPCGIRLPISRVR